MSTNYTSFKSFTETLGDAIIPKRYRKRLLDYLRKASIPKVPYFYFGSAIYADFILSVLLIILFLSSSFFMNMGFFGKFLLSIFFIPTLFIILLFLTLLAFKTYLDLKIQIKISQMKFYFPEFLSALALNLRIGGTLDVALEGSADKEFGVLADEIKLVVRNIRMGKNEHDAIKEFTNKYNVPVISDTFELIMMSWKKGGNTANLTDRIYDNMKESRFLRDKIIASVTNYRIFLTVLAIVIAPAMFALTYHLIDLIRRVSMQVANIPNNVALPFHMNVVQINDPHFIAFSTLAVILISIAIAFIISIVKTGEAKQAYKQIIFYAVSSFIVFRICMYVFGLFFKLFNI